MQKTTYHVKWSEEADLEREQIARCFGPGGQGKGRQGPAMTGVKDLSEARQVNHGDSSTNLYVH